MKQWPITNDDYKSSNGRAYDQKQSTTGRYPGLSFIYFPSINARACSRIKFSFGYFWSLIIPGGDQRERWIGEAYEHESYTDYIASICLDGGMTTEGDLNSTHLKFYCSALQTSSVGEVCEYPEVSSFHFNPYLILELVLVLVSCSVKIYRKFKKNERSFHGDNIEFSSTKRHGKYSQSKWVSRWSWIQMGR